MAELQLARERLGGLFVHAAVVHVTRPATRSLRILWRKFVVSSFCKCRLASSSIFACAFLVTHVPPNRPKGWRWRGRFYLEGVLNWLRNRTIS